MYRVRLKYSQSLRVKISEIMFLIYVWHLEKILSELLKDRFIFNLPLYILSIVCYITDIILLEIFENVYKQKEKGNSLRIEGLRTENWK